MNRRGSRGGFSLIELMIVIAIIAVIFSIAIVGFISIRRASNEKSTSASIKSLTTGEESFKNNDLDLNLQNDYWTGDVAGLYSIQPAGSSKSILAISDVALASADTAPVTSGAYNNGRAQTAGTPLTQSPKTGYWVQAMLRDVQGADLMQDTDTFGAVHSNGGYGFCAVPVNYGVTGTFCYIVNHGNAIFRRDFGTATPVVPSPVVRFTFADLDQWPTGPTLSSSWDKSE